MRYLYLLLFVLVGAALAVVVVNNASPIQIAFFTWQSPELPVGVVMAGAVIVGAILLYLITTVSALQDWHELRQLRDRVRSLEGRVAALGH